MEVTVDNKRAASVVTSEERSGPPPVLRGFLRWICQPLCLNEDAMFPEEEEGAKQHVPAVAEERSATALLELELQEEREKMASLNVELQDKLAALEQAALSLEELQRDLRHVTIERDTLKSAVSSIFQANKIVKKDILHVDETQDFEDSPVLSGISTPRRMSLDPNHEDPSPRSPTPYETLHTARESLLSRVSIDE